MMQLKGRHWVLLWLLSFWEVQWRLLRDKLPLFRPLAGSHDLREERRSLEAQRADLERRIRLASSREILVPMAKRTFGLHEPADSEFVLFPAPPVPGEIEP